MAGKKKFRRIAALRLVWVALRSCLFLCCELRAVWGKRLFACVLLYELGSLKETKKVGRR